jgi:hypothetical protein
MEQNKTGKPALPASPSGRQAGRYFKYAIGEIVLVVIGILIALQINNWNEGRKRSLEELSLLEELKADLEFSKSEIDTIAFYNQVTVDSYHKIYEYIENDLPYNEELNYAFTHLDIWHWPYLPDTSYKTLESKGIDIITNDSLRRQISHFYNFNLKRLLEDYGQWEWSFNQNSTQRLMVKNIRRDVSGKNTAFPNDFETLKMNDEFINFLSILINIREEYVENSEEVSSTIENLLEHLNQELTNRK